MSDEDFSEEDDFSASEEEWTPGGKYDEADDDSDEEDVEDNQTTTDLDQTDIIKKKKRKGDGSLNITKENKKLKRKAAANNSLRAKMFKKYQPPPKVVRSSILDRNSPTTSKLSATPSSNVKKNSNKISNKASQSQESDSSSSGDEALVDPNKLDLKSSFFEVGSKKTKTSVSPPPNFDCDGGLDLNNSDDEDDEFIDADTENNDKFSGSENPFKNFYEFNEKVEQVKDSLKKYETEQPNSSGVGNDDIAKLLSMGEKLKPSQSDDKNKKKTKKLKTDKNENSDSDWENVEENRQLDTTCRKEDGSIQITLEHLRHERRPKKSVSDEEASLMRKLNRVIKENQMNKHKTSLLCQIAHGNFLNRILNNTELMSEALKLLPNGNKCYPSGKTEIGYFEAITKWYNAKVKYDHNVIYPNLNKESSLLDLFMHQIRNREALCRKSFVLIFVALLRAMGIQCRMVINLVTLPIRPAQQDLCSIKMKRNAIIPKKKAHESLNKEEHESLNKEAQSSQINKSIKSNENLRPIKLITKKPKKTEPRIIQPSHIFDEVLEKTSKERKAILSTKKSRSLESPSTSSEIPEEVVIIDENISEKKKSPIDLKKLNKVRSQTTNDEDWQPSTSKKLKDNENNAVGIKRKTRASIKNENKSGEKATKATKPKAAEPVKVASESKPPKRKLRERPNNATNEENILPTKKRLVKAKTNITNIKDNNSLGKSMVPEKLLAMPGTSQSHNSQNTNNNKMARTRSKLAANRAEFNLPQMDGGNDIKIKKLNKPNDAEESNSDDDFVNPPKNILKKSVLEKLKKIDRRMLSTDNDSDDAAKSKSNKKQGMDFWIEVYSEKEDQWITIDVFHTKVHCVDSIRKQATPPISYVFAWNNDNSIKDVSARYCPEWNTTTRKNRVEKEWLDIAVKKFLGKKNARDISEDEELDKIHLDKPLPKTINEFKNHPLYVLERHLLKFEVLYPPNALTLGFVRGEPIYARDCVHLCHSREIWLKEARVVKPGEKAYKVVKARPKWDKLTNTIISNLPLDIFGYWQTMEYDPPVAENGIVPRNAYGNVELFKDCMLPKKTVHLRLPGLPRVCKKLQIDCAPAVIGFDFHQGSCHPMLDGFVICEEFKETVVAAWEQEQEEIERKEQEKYEQRVYGNWKKLVKGLFIREKLKIKYNFEGNRPSTSKKKR